MGGSRHLFTVPSALGSIVNPTGTFVKESKESRPPKLLGLDASTSKMERKACSGATVAQRAISAVNLASPPFESTEKGEKRATES